MNQPLFSRAVGHLHLTWGVFERSLVPFWFLLVIIFAQNAAAAEPVQPKNVLILYSFSDRALFDPLDNLKAMIRTRAHSPVNFYVQYMEAQGFEDPKYESSLSDTLSREFKGIKLDLVIVAAYPALNFAVTHREQMFPGVPVLFCYVHGGRLAGKKLPPGVTGVSISIGLRDTLELAFRLHPDTKNLAVVTGTSEFERYWLAALRNEFRPFASKVKLIEIVGLQNDDILKQVVGIPAHTMVLFQFIPRDSIQPAIGTYDTIAAISHLFPTYCFFRNFCVGHGGIGGSYADYAEQSSKTGEMAARILSGEKPENIAVLPDSGTRATVDWRQLQRWNIRETALPPGSLILYRQPTAWEQYRKYILAVATVLLLQAVLIAGLLWQRFQWKSASAAMKRLGRLLIHSQEEERANIARELHDDFSQRLAVQCIELEQLRKRLPESDVEDRDTALSLLKGTREMSADMRSLSHQLHSSRLELVGLSPALSGLCQEISRHYQIAVGFSGPDVAPDLTKDEGLCLFRVAQEALTNAVKHSHSSTANVILDANANEVRLRISDTGKGFDPDLNGARAGIGLMSMRERVQLLGGRLSVHSELARGTEVLAQLPLSHSAKRHTRHPGEGKES